MEATEIKYQKHLPKDYKSENAVRWCPGCGDYAILNCLHKAMAELNIEPHETAVISGIGCSSRLPYYMNTYGFHSIHGRATAIATGVKVANPKLSVWVATGDGDSLAIGGNHFIHAVRRNVDINILLFNNKIYGLTKGQYSPTSDRGFVSKSSPYGTVEDPFRPAELTFGARGTFFARALDVDMKNQVDAMVDAARHKGTSVIEILQNCVIFNNGIHNKISDRSWKADNTVLLKHGEKMIFGKDENRGIVLDGWDLKAVTIGEDGYTIDDVLVHDSTTVDNSLHMKLALMDTANGLPVALGVIRNVDEPSYENDYEKQIAEVQKKMPKKTFTEFLLNTPNVWEVK
ncbi:MULTISPECIES: 2-oxoacid:ferredoxin oxidoreductase subunit beta [Proteiniphilum]|jgi:2-oxoglutarate ferredoxin oxidoreductase subunit beta|uniref:2-oxoacid:ferredoxin oxidoreductase subunit beta n=1 Tax=Proteiniphilum TaxID=294702 RepID=UPI001EEBD21E|nr:MULTISPECIES: 2-oxoacid:ferredoxin oxidoreductase subunit beta [Proteiniphilum]ULB33143.1 2-oxoacid:ferredoxin oxidoreductase subunit beta [Proteiniphilum propionicum]